MGNPRHLDGIHWLVVGGESYWVYQLSSWRDEFYSVARVRPEDVRPVVAVAGVLGVVLTIVAHRWRLARATPPPQPSLDFGQAVHIRTWNPNGTARVSYRGADWDAELVAADKPRAETMYIVATRANTLVLSDRKPAS